MSADTVVPSDSISQAPYHSWEHRSRNSRHHHHSSRHDPNSERGLTEANLRAFTASYSNNTAAAPRAHRRERADEQIEVREAAEIEQDHEYYDYAQADAVTLKARSSPRHSGTGHSAAQSKVSSSPRSGPVCTKVREDMVVRLRDDHSDPRPPRRWVIVEVDEYDDRIVEREYTIERVKRYHYSD